MLLAVFSSAYFSAVMTEMPTSVDTVSISQILLEYQKRPCYQIIKLSFKMHVFRLTYCHLRRIKRFSNGVDYTVTMLQPDPSDTM